MADSITMEDLRNTDLYAEITERREAHRMEIRRAAVERMEALHGQYAQDVADAEKRVREAREQVEAARKSLRAAELVLGDAEAGQLALSSRIERESNRCRSLIAQTLPAGLDDCISNLRHALMLERNKVHGREVEERRSLSNPLPRKREISNIDQVTQRTTEIELAIAELEATKTSALGTAEIQGMMDEFHTRFELGHLDGIRRPTIKHV